jgi:hypothetical protein
MEIVTFDQIIQNVVLELENDVDNNSAPIEIPKPKKARKAGSGRKQLYTSKCVSFVASVPSEAIDELKDFTINLKAKYKK